VILIQFNFKGFYMDNYSDEAQVYNDECEYVDEMPVRSAKQGDTVASATKKVVAQLAASIDYLSGASETLEVPATYKEAKGAYYVGVKYSNKFLAGVFNDGQSKFAKVKTAEACVAKLQEVKARVQAGECNDALKAAIAANIRAHNQRKAAA
jgi:hypothetical protein